MANQEGRSSSAGDISPVEIQKYMHGIDFPAEKKDLLEQARSNDAPDAVMDFLDRFPDRKYNSPADVSQAYGESH